MRIRQVPRLTFELDPGIVAGQRIEEILRGIHHDDASEDEAGEAGGVTEDELNERRRVEAALTRAAAAIGDRAAQSALACHVNPDGDALGSMLALHHVLLAAGVPSRRVVLRRRSSSRRTTASSPVSSC